MNTLIRLLVVASFVLLASFACYWVRAGLKPPSVKMPDQDFHKMPLVFDDWQGEDVELDPKVFIKIGADVVIDRKYRNDRGQVISTHTAVFSDPDEGVMHNPMNCYRVTGWQKVDDEYLMLEAPGKTPVKVRCVAWNREGERALVVYWYQLGEHSLFNRLDLGKLRWEMGGVKTWPALLKIMLHMPSSDHPAGDRAAIMDLAGKIYGWIE